MASSWSKLHEQFKVDSSVAIQKSKDRLNSAKALNSLFLSSFSNHTVFYSKTINVYHISLALRCIECLEQVKKCFAAEVESKENSHLKHKVKSSPPVLTLLLLSSLWFHAVASPYRAIWRRHSEPFLKTIMDWMMNFSRRNWCLQLLFRRRFRSKRPKRKCKNNQNMPRAKNECFSRK